MDRLNQSTYFPGLNGLRFIAAMLVIISHVEEMKQYFHYDNIRDHPAIYNMGSTAVTFFFVLSGFLITYLLLVEKQQKGYIALKDFYLKRVVRIWPLYYIVTLLGLFILPHVHSLDIPTELSAQGDNFTLKASLLLFILPNVVFANGISMPYMVQTWSIGVEEQFYIIWPLVILYSRKYVKGILATIFIYIGIVFLIHIGMRFTDSSFLQVLLRFVKLTRIDCMAIGGLGAYVLFEQKQRILRLIYHPVTEAFAWMGSLLVFAQLIRFPAFTQEIYSVLFLLIILNAASNSRTLSVHLLENKVFNYLGKISYGLYMYHFMIIGLSLAILRPLANAGHLGWSGNISLYGLTFLLTIGVSALSFATIEQKVMSLRVRISRMIPSRKQLTTFLSISIHDNKSF